MSHVGRQQKPDARKIFVTTTLGTSVFHPNTRVIVPLGGEFFGKLARDVQEGDSVLFVKQALRGGGTAITLEDVDAVLKQSGRYRHALAELFVQCPDGSTTTAFKNELLGGIAAPQSTLLWPEAVRRENVKLIVTQRNVNQIEEKPLELTALFVHETLTAQQARAGNPIVSGEHILRGWLGGVTLAPREFKKVFDALSGIAPGLLQLASSQKFEESYKLYVAIRQGVMRAIWDVLGEGKKEGGESGGNERGEDRASFTIRPEIRLVAQHFIQEVHELHAAARVVKVEVRKCKGEEHEEGVLSRGIATEANAEGLKMKTMRELDLELCVLNGLMRRLVHGYLKRRHYSGFKRVNRHTLQVEVLTHIGEMLGFRKMADMQKENIERMKKAGIIGEDIATSPEPEKEKVCREMSVEIVRALEDGTIDRMYELPNGLARKAFEAGYERISAVPRIVYYKKTLAGMKTFERTDKAKLREETRRVEAEIAANYAKYDSWVDVMQDVEMAALMFNASLVDVIYEQHAEPVLKLLAQMSGRNAGEMLRGHKKENVVTDEIARKALTGLGFEEVIKIYRFAGVS
ncbi:hypothetical protein HY992_01095 [Candidatus Micrarchaeota archaeon]|nr:hypothetical protein [Candidatus Micrarchaeota archaeon]